MNILDPNYDRGSILPVVRDRRTGQRGFGAPQWMADLLSAVMLPGDVYQGNVLLRDPETGMISDEIIKRSADLAGALTLGAGAVPAQANSLRMGIKAYHGSPHDFDKFEWSPRTRGTGEGAQAYGDGLYFAEAEDVARGYRDALRFPRIKSPKNVVEQVADDLNYHRGNIDSLKGIYQSMINRGDEAAKKMGREKLDALPLAQERFKSHMYEVDINADPADFLDWDKPLSEQKVGPVLNEKFGVKPGWTGAQAYESSKLVPGEFKDSAKASQVLLDAGIPGIKYLDAGSRDGGGGTSNYVVFDDRLISIVKKYGIAALVTAGVISQQDGEALAAQGYE